jgi:hypothetical protein
MRAIGLLLTVAIIAVLAVIIFRSTGMVNSNETHGVQWYIDHSTERRQQIDYCNQHAESSGSQECSAAIQAQAQVDASKVNP